MSRTHAPTSGSSRPPSSSSASFATPGDDLDDAAEDAAALLDDLEADELEDVVLVLARSAGSASRAHLERRPARDRAVEPDHGPAAGAAPRDDDLGLARRRRAGATPAANQRASSLASSTKNAPSSPCGRPDPADETRPGCRSHRRSRPARGGRRGRQLARIDRAQRAHDPPAAADHLADVVRRRRAAGGRARRRAPRLDPHGIGIVDELAREDTRAARPSGR